MYTSALFVGFPEFSSASAFGLCCMCEEGGPGQAQVYNVVAQYADGDSDCNQDQDSCPPVCKPSSPHLNPNFAASEVASGTTIHNLQH